MFSGLIEQISKIENISFTDQGANVSFKANFDDVKIGDSIAVNGVCLTVVKVDNDIFYADIMKETLNSTNFKTLKANDVVNLERALKVSDRLNGHIVSGHVDCCAKVMTIINDGFSKKMKLICDSKLIIQKGSIAINGVSLTVSNVYDDGFEVSLIPETQQKTNLLNLNSGDLVNIEYDIFAKYIQKLTMPCKSSKITEEFLRENGF